jgi:chromosome segregation ATPase
LTTERIAELRRLLAESLAKLRRGNVRAKALPTGDVEVYGSDGIFIKADQHTADVIAAAVNALPDLLDALEAWELDRDHWRASASRYSMEASAAEEALRQRAAALARAEAEIADLRDRLDRSAQEVVRRGHTIAALEKDVHRTLEAREHFRLKATQIMRERDAARKCLHRYYRLLGNIAPHAIDDDLEEKYRLALGEDP